MRIALGIPVFNELSMLKFTISNIIDMGFDYVVYLDDGSTDGTYEFLKDISLKNKNVYVFKSENNSVLTRGTNRWKILAEHCKSFNPDWIMVRAADQKFSAPSKKLLRPRLEALLKTNTVMVFFPLVHFWRSKWWYRVDQYWGHSAYTHISDSCWRNDIGWSFDGDYNKSIMHQGGHKPNKFSVKYIRSDINTERAPYPISILHYGMASNELLTKKLESQFIGANKTGGGVLLPTTENMPHPNKWVDFNGYKVGYECGIKLEKAHDFWFEESIPDEPKPEIKSMYNMISKYNLEMAEEYAKIYGK